MRLIDLLNRLEASGMLAPLYKAGVVGLAAYSRREVYNTYQALLATPKFIDKPSKAAAETAATLKIARSTTYLAIREMEREVESIS